MGTSSQKKDEDLLCWLCVHRPRLRNGGSSAGPRNRRRASSPGWDDDSCGPHQTAVAGARGGCVREPPPPGSPRPAPAHVRTAQSGLVITNSRFYPEPGRRGPGREPRAWSTAWLLEQREDTPLSVPRCLPPYEEDNKTHLLTSRGGFPEKAGLMPRELFEHGQC